MRQLLLAVCLIASIYAYQRQKYDFHVVLDEVVYSNVPAKYELGKVLLLSTAEKSLKDILFKNLTQSRSGTEAVINEYADKIFENLHEAMVHQGYDPVEMPDLHSGFSYTLIITYHGELDLTRGWIQDLSTLHRGGDVMVEYSSNKKYLEVTVPIAFKDLEFTYDYSAKIMGLGPTGGVEGKVVDLAVEVKIGIDTETFVASLEEFYITKAGTITFDFTGHALIDWLLDLLVDVATLLFKKVILEVAEGVVRGGLGSFIDTINAVIGGFLDPAANLIAQFIK